ncbi:cytochrome P450-family protein [Mesorhizobium alhagi CCNWXJ12-2]|uniref:Cytochrome P450-family protein n=1 Tax=Mesorhizobium alhagi CCNWXJ12-2 TaxID=1107882 RepID=H0HX15_9HYPH|nr:cytochrome P450-family protein [Mesorhizobium alhagi CCNWXJ12-2]
MRRTGTKRPSVPAPTGSISPGGTTCTCRSARGRISAWGAALARLELRCAFPALFVRLEDLALTIAAEDVVYMPSYVIRCPQRLPVTFRPSVA